MRRVRKEIRPESRLHARKKLEEGFVAEAMPDFATHINSIQTAKDRVSNLTTKVRELRTQISELEKTLVDHRKPADELNDELRGFLGRDDIKLDVRDNRHLKRRLDQHLLLSAAE